MNCKDCLYFIPSDKRAGGRCKYKSKKTCFPDDTCNCMYHVDGVMQYRATLKKPPAVAPEIEEEVWP